MNIMTLQRYKNEIILLIAVLFSLFAFSYKFSADNYVKENRVNIQKQINEVNTISNLKEQWGSKKIANSVKSLKSIVPKDKIKLFNKKSKKLVASYQNLTANELNKITNKLINIPVQIVIFKINQSNKNQYTVEFTCKW